MIALQANPKDASQSYMNRFSGRPRTWLEWRDKRGKLRLMCGAYILEDGSPLSYYHIAEVSGPLSAFLALSFTLFPARCH